MVSAIVLAAGESSRFGQCKQLMLLGEKTILEHVLDALAQSAVDNVIVVLGAHANDIKKRVQFVREQIVVNPNYAQGMSSSIRSGVRALDARCEAALMVLGDQPFVTPQTLDRIIDEYRRTKAPIVIPTYRGARGNPVIVDHSVFPRMMELSGDVGFRSLFKELPVVKFPVEDVGIVTDIDTQDDFDEVTGH